MTSTTKVTSTEVEVSTPDDLIWQALEPLLRNLHRAATRIAARSPRAVSEVTEFKRPSLEYDADGDGDFQNEVFWVGCPDSDRNSQHFGTSVNITDAEDCTSYLRTYETISDIIDLCSSGDESSRNPCYRCRDVVQGLRNLLKLGRKPGEVDWPLLKLRRVLAGDKVDWLIPGVMERGKLAALFGPPKSGKSLLALQWATELVQQGKTVLYLDEENDPMDVYDRIAAMGVDINELDGLVYRSFLGHNVDVPGQVEEEDEDGTKVSRDDAIHPIVALAESVGADLVIFDSWAKFFAAGSQNDDAAINRAYRLVLKPLKRKGIAVLRLDHTGHGEARRPAGSVQKLADVDHNWLIRAEDAPGRSARRVTLTHTENRTGQGEDVIILDRLTGPLRHVPVGQGAKRAPVDIEAEETKEDGKVAVVVEKLDELAIPPAWPVARCIEALKQVGASARKQTVAEAQRVRKAT